MIEHSYPLILNHDNSKDINNLIVNPDFPGMVVLIDKDKGPTSFDIIYKLRKLLKIRKIGHAGTLDPLATGLLIICVGKATKKISLFQDLPKSYEALIKLGATTKSADSEFDEQNINDVSDLKLESIVSVIESFIGKQEQFPPIFSAKKVNGKRLYKYARNNEEVEIKPSWIEIYSIEILSVDIPFIKILVNCSKGTYIRSLARDIGAKIGCGAYLYELRRTSIGDFNIDKAFTLQELNELIVIDNQN